jgi:hypothetical protein
MCSLLLPYSMEMGCHIPQSPQLGNAKCPCPDECTHQHAEEYWQKINVSTMWKGGQTDDMHARGAQVFPTGNYVMGYVDVLEHSHPGLTRQYASSKVGASPGGRVIASEHRSHSSTAGLSVVRPISPPQHTTSRRYHLQKGLQMQYPLSYPVDSCTRLLDVPTGEVTPV